MKQLFTTAGVLFSMTVFAQVGINNTSPKATLDITAKTTGSKPEGLIVPQLTGDQIRAASTGSTPVYGSAQKGLILFASAADTAPAGATANITAPGYYYFDGSVWQKILGSSSGDTTNDAFVNDTSNSMVKIGTKSDGTARATGTDFVVTDNGSVGIGTASPKGPLNISYSNATTAITNSTLSPGIILTGQSNASGGGPGLYFEGQNNNTGTRVFKFNLIKDASGDGLLNVRSVSDDAVSVIRSIMSINARGYVGIGTEAPKSYFHANTPTAGGLVDAGIFSINNCGGSCGQPTARNIVLNNLNGTNGLFASIDFVPSLDPTAPSGASIQGIDRDATNNYAGLVFYTRNATDYASRMIIKSSGRVGIGTSAESPQATLDVKAISSAGTSPEGIIAPRLSLTALQGYTYGTNQTGAMVYVNSVSGTPAGQTANVTAVGYYYFDGTNWLKMTTGASVTDATTTAKGIVQLAGDLSGTAASPSIATSAVTSAKIADGTVANADLASGTGGIYKGDGSLSGNTTVTQGTNTLAFTSTATAGTSHFTVDGTTLNVDAVNNRVGIGTAAPKTYLQVQSPAGSATPVAAFSSVNCGAGCGQGTARNIVLNNNQANNSLFASVDFVPGTDPTGSSGATIQGIDRDATNNYAGLSFYTRNATDFASRLAIKSSGSVGIGAGAESPNATLDVKAITAGTSPEGIIAPRLSLTALQGYTYGTNQTGAMVYVNSVSGTPAGQTANVTAVGYYYFDGTNWQKVANGASVTDATTTAKGIVQLAGDLAGTAASPSIATSAVTSAKIADGTVANADLASGAGGIYKGSGSLSGNTTVTQGTNTLAFSTSATNGFSVAGSTLSVDGANNRVGIGTASPNTKLHTVSSTAYGAFQMQDGSEASGKFLSSNATGQATWVNSPLTPVAFGALNTTTMTVSPNTFLNSSVTLTQGKWLVYVGLLLTTTGTATTTDNAWIRLTLGSNNSGTSATQSGFNFLASSLVSGWLSTVNATGSASSKKWTFINGVIPVNVTSSSQTIYLWTREIGITGTDPGATVNNAGENYFFAVPAN
ncbi:hypothetical protein SAMN05421856_106210 [Chryseobacterium taichungense]|uniref:Uncharacterized protein n=1 Tax=Chryseobacterium taichungense TaxID=295069 RepID=A0A1H8B2B4_9FLAO|nr:hypothetical protein [Chryseobacterium taichungense]SEM77080.1 hypothetical protein SAMN05421856_106210 [Chryseobacterium taichungense]